MKYSYMKSSTNKSYLGYTRSLQKKSNFVSVNNDSCQDDSINSTLRWEIWKEEQFGE